MSGRRRVMIQSSSATPKPGAGRARGSGRTPALSGRTDRRINSVGDSKVLLHPQLHPQLPPRRHPAPSSRPVSLGNFDEPGCRPARCSKCWPLRGCPNCNGDTFRVSETEGTNTSRKHHHLTRTGSRTEMVMLFGLARRTARKSRKNRYFTPPRASASDSRP